MRLKSLAALVFVFLVIPGSGQLAWDGLPLSTRIEFATLVLFIIAVLDKNIRGTIRGWLGDKSWRSAVKPMLVVLSLFKLLTFTWYPFSDGYDACYRSLYSPLENPGACEKSYEGPFLRRSDLGLSNTSRTDRTVDFGVQMYDWSLPFMNEYPRLGALWLTRFPFTATYGAVVSSNTETDQFLPIFSNGEVAASLGDEEIDNSPVPLPDQYQFTRLQFLPIPKAPAELLVKYKFTDDDATIPPDAEPLQRGPYAQLKIGVPQSRKAILEYAKVRIRGWTLDVDKELTPNSIIAVNDANQEIARTNPESRLDVATFWYRPRLKMNGFNFTVPASAVATGVVKIQAVYDTRTVTIGVLRSDGALIPAAPLATTLGVPGVRSQLETWLDGDREAFEALAPVGRQDPGRLFLLLSLILDGAGGLLFVGLAALLLRQVRWWIPVGVAGGAIAFPVLRWANGSAPVWLGSALVIPILILATLAVVLRTRLRTAPLVTFVPLALALAHVKAFDFLHRFISGGGERWWGRLLFYWRDSDWYATQGYARHIFVSGSLHGGESTFWFQAGPRYLAFVTRSLLGENDVLVGLLMTMLGFLAVMFLYLQFTKQHGDTTGTAVGTFVLIVLLLFMTEDLIAGFGFVGSSEYPTWILLFFVTAFLVSRTSESRTWVLVAISGALGYCIQLRPNQIGGVVALFVAILLIVDRRSKAGAINNIALMVTTFGVVCSLSLLHNLYYGESFTLFTANGEINVQFEWTEVLRSGDVSEVWDQLRTMMYWNSTNTWPWAFAFWGAQALWVIVIVLRVANKQISQARTLALLIPFGYALPMLKYQMGSYYPRHLVAINLSFMCAALIAWPRLETRAKADASTPSDAPEVKEATQPIPV